MVLLLSDLRDLLNTRLEVHPGGGLCGSEATDGWGRFWAWGVCGDGIDILCFAGLGEGKAEVGYGLG